MRKIAQVKDHHTIKRAMIYSSDDGTYLFVYISPDDHFCNGDSWHESIADAEELASTNLGVDMKDWTEITDPLEGCQVDFIRPVRVIGRAEGKPQWGKYEELIDGKWKAFNLYNY